MSTSDHLNSAPASNGTTYFVYIGTYGKGIYGYRFDPGTAKLESLGMVGEVVNPSFLATDHDYRYLYAASELEGKVNGAVASFAIDRKSGSLKFLNSRSSGGEAPCHLAVDKTNKMLVAANYGTGTVPAFPIQHDGHLGEMSALMAARGSSVNPERQEGPHAHETVISADNRFLYVPDLGLDQIRIYRLDPSSAQLTPATPPFVKEEPGLGPRHIAFPPNGKHAYVINELKSVVTVFSHDPSTGDLTHVQTVSTVPEGFSGENGPAEIEIDPAGKFVYASNRGPGTIAVFAVDPGNGTLHRVQIAETGGTFPRGFQIDPTGQFVFCGDQKSNQFVIFRINPKSGKLTLTGQRFDVPSPVAFQFVP
ncbi:MAG: lactonase family protein, partial [Acidobacteriaceae bacterium]|nr:lactonase family protein [Acidobacteriaceae bacterium]